MTLPSTLFHYTSAESWEQIRTSGYIDTTSQAARHLDGQARHVWLTDSHGHDSGLRDPDRTIVRISVAPVPSILYWPLWRELCDNRTAVEQAGGDPAAWYLTDQPITAEHWGTVTRIDTDETLLSTDLAEQPVSSWATMPIPTRIAEAIRRLDRLRPSDPFRAYRIDQQIATLEAIVARGETQQRQRAGWRTLKAELAAFPKPPAQ
ncbi:hypothetical protein KPP03845_107444 [Streptomyces xanthophaeus]|uniref:hypothetical protein n=1 Tax=Streptomyces xanthophaeus TaxID=67385 RepID=UPI00233F5588|nr:hypothetical protein [Streptomyces xanthophaeus]WCD91015.1 hypothetical protein KPP03845_107444 [Streptomyces xanthophaeus]